MLSPEISEGMRDNLGNIDILKVAEIAPTLPRNDANVMDNLLKAAGIPAASSITKAVKPLKDVTKLVETKGMRAQKVVADRARKITGQFLKQAPNTSSTTKL